MSGSVRVGLIGLGWWGGVLTEACTRAEVEVVTAWSPSAGSRQAYSERFGVATSDGYDHVLADDRVDAVLLATPHSTHALQIGQAAAAGKHVFVEKPLTLRFADGRRAVEAARAADIILQVGHWRRRPPALRRLKALVDSGELGIVHYAEANLSYPKGLTPRTGWRADRAESPAGGMTGLGVHMADILFSLLGPAARLTAVSKRIAAVGPLDDVTSALIEYESGPVATLTTSMVVADVARTAVHGTRATAWTERDGAVLCLQHVGEQQPVVIEYPSAQADPVVEQLEEFAGCIRSGREPEVTGDVALESVAVLEAITESAERGGWIDMNEVRRR